MAQASVTTGLSRVAKPTLAEVVYQQLLDAILAGHLPSGTYLNVPDIAREMGVSPTPVRDALVRLTAEGLVVSGTNRRASVVRFEREDVEQLFDLRDVLESAAAERAATRISEAEVTQLNDLVERCAKLADQPKKKQGVLNLDQEIHTCIAVGSGNPVLSDEVARCSSRVRVMQRLMLGSQHMPGAAEEHRAIVKALTKRDGLAARRSMSQHIRSSLDRLLAGLA